MVQAGHNTSSEVPIRFGYSVIPCFRGLCEERLPCCHVSGLDLDLTSHIEPSVSSDLVGRQKRGKGNSCHFDRIKLD